MEETRDKNGGGAIAAGKPKTDNVQRWSRWATFALERLPLPYGLIVALAAVMALAEQVLEYSLDDPTFSRLTSAAVELLSRRFGRGRSGHRAEGAKTLEPSLRPG